MHLMLDLETLGTGTTASIIEIGAVLFEPKAKGKIWNDKRAFQCFVNPDPKATVSMSTVFWWFKQSQQARERFSSNYPQNFFSEKCAAIKFSEWPAIEEAGGWDKIEGVWSHGAAFDQPLLTSLFERVGYSIPWKYSVSLDTRTLFSLVGGYPTVDNLGFVPHSALDDAIYQTLAVQNALGKLEPIIKAMGGLK